MLSPDTPEPYTVADLVARQRAGWMLIPKMSRSGKGFSIVDGQYEVEVHNPLTETEEPDEVLLVDEEVFREWSLPS